MVEIIIPVFFYIGSINTVFLDNKQVFLHNKRKKKEDKGVMIFLA